MNSLRKNLVINVSYQFVVILLPLILAPYVTRTIGPEGAGVYSYTFSIASFFGLFGMLGIANYGNRSIAVTGEDIRTRSEVFWNIWSLQLVCSLIACSAYCIYCAIGVKENMSIAFLQILTVFCSCLDINWFFFGIEKFQVTVLRNLIVKAINLILIFGFVKKPEDLLVYVVIMLGCALVNNVLLFFFLKEEIIYVKPSWSKIKQHIKPVIVLFFPVIAVSLYKLMDKVMIGFLASTTQTGYYEYAEKIISLPCTFITAVGSVMLPRLSSMFGHQQQNKASYLMQVTIEVMMFLVIGMSAGIFCIAEDFAIIFFGEKFSTSGCIMMILSVSVVFQGWANIIRTQYLIPAKKDVVYVQSAWIGAMVNLLINMLLIPTMKAAGAAIGTVCAEIAVALYQSIRSSKELPVLGYLKKVCYYLIAGCCMWISIKVFDRLVPCLAIWKLISEILIGAIVYLFISVPYLYRRYKQLKSYGSV